MFSRRTAVAFAICTAALLIPAADAKTPLKLGVTEGASKGVMAAEMAPVMKHLNTSAEYAFELKVFPTQDDLSRALRAGEVHLALIGALKYVDAHQQIGAVPIVSEGATGRSVILVPRNSPFQSVEQLKGKRFAFGYPDSTMTYLIPMLILSKYGIHKGDIQSTFVGHHAQDLIDQMLAGKFDACAVSEYIFDKNKAKVRILEASDRFPGPAIVSRGDLQQATAAAIRDLFVKYKAAQADENRRFGRGAVPTADADYNRIRFLAKVLLDKTYH